MTLPLLSRPTGLSRAILLLAAGLLATGILACSHEEPLPLQPSSSPPVLSKGGETGVEWLVAVEEGYTAEDVALETGWILLESYPEENLALFYDEDGEATRTPSGIVSIQRIETNDRLVGVLNPVNLTTGFYEGEVDDDVYSGQNALELLDLGAIHTEFRGAGIHVAIIDTGVDVDHPHLKTHLDFSKGDGPLAADDRLGHGTWVAGIIAAVAPDAALTSYNIFGTSPETSDYEIAEALGRVLQDGADVVNLSLRLDLASPVVELKIQQLEAAGIMVVAAAGNTNGGPPVFPAVVPETISFAATKEANKIATFSARDDEIIDFAAPGEGIFTTAPGDEEHPDGGWATVTGTSMACAVGSGIFALGLEAYEGTHTPAQVLALAEAEAVDVDPIDAVIHGLISTRFMSPRVPGYPIIPLPR